MNIEYLREFLDLANTLNFTKTSNNLHMTQPTLSRHIAELEQEIGAPLFVRTTNSVKPTQAGRLLYEKASVLVSDYSSLVETVQAATKSAVTTLRVGGSSVQPTITRLYSKLATQAAANLLPIRFEYYKSRSLSNDAPAPYALDALKDHTIDFAIDACAFNEDPPLGFEAMRLCDEPLAVVASSDNPLAGAHGIEPTDLLANTLVTYAVQQHCPLVLQAPMIAAGYSPTRAKTVFIDNMMEIPEHLGMLRPDEIVPIQQYYCEMFGFDQDGMEKLTRLDTNEASMRSSFWAVWRKGEKDRNVLAAIELLADIIADYKEKAAPDRWSTADTLWSSAFYVAG